MQVTDPITEASLALRLANKAHEGHYRFIGSDRGQSYFHTHVRRVVRAVPPECRALAALHDVIEDTQMTFDDLRDAGILETTLTRLDLITHRSGLRYYDYISQIVDANDSITLRVKLADLADDLATWPEACISRCYIRAMALIADRIGR